MRRPISVRTDQADFLRHWAQRAAAEVADDMRCDYRPLNKRTGKHPARASLVVSSANFIAGLSQRARPDNANGADIYIGANPFTEDNGRSTIMPCWLWADIDFPKVDDCPSLRDRDVMLADASLLNILPCTMLVATGGGVQAWWNVTDLGTLSTARISGALKAIAARVGGDPSVCDVTRILRVPGTLNHKYDPPRPARLLSSEQRDYTFEHVARAFGFPRRFDAPRPTFDCTARPLPRPSASPLDVKPFDLANNLPIAMILTDYLGGVLHAQGRRLFGRCPVHKGVSLTHMAVGTTRNVATCFSDCGGRSYSVVDLVAGALKITPRDAVNRLALHYGFPGLGA